MSRVAGQAVARPSRSSRWRACALLSAVSVATTAPGAVSVATTAPGAISVATTPTSAVSVATTPTSAVSVATTRAPAPAELAVNASSMDVNQQQGSFTVTLSLTKVTVNSLKGPQPAAPLDQPLTVDFSALLDQPGSGPSEAASPIFAPFQESVTFPAGESTETITVPIISSAATTGPVTIDLSAVPTSSTSSGISSGSGNVELYSSPDATPPTITSVQLVNQGQRVRRRARIQQTDGAGDRARHPQLSDLVAAAGDPPYRFSFRARRGMVDQQRRPLLRYPGGDL